MATEISGKFTDIQDALTSCFAEIGITAITFSIYPTELTGFPQIPNQILQH